MKHKFRQRDLARLSNKYGFPGNEGIVWTAQKIAKIDGDQIPKTKNECREYLYLKCERPTLEQRAEKRKERRRAWNPNTGINPNSDDFLTSYEWRRVRMVALKKYGPRCQCCGATPADGVKMHVDHIKPRRIFPDLALDVSNLQILCEVCNHGKGNWDMTDWREPELDPEAKAHMKSI